jgi:hypothetical protein
MILISILRIIFLLLTEKDYSMFYLATIFRASKGK